MLNFQILECSEILGTCCSDYGLVMILNIVRRFFDILQILVPIILILATAIQCIKLVTHMDEKAEKQARDKMIKNAIATVLIFFLPVIVDTVMALLPTSESFQVASCWQTASSYAEMMGEQDSTYVDTTSDERSSIVINPGDYDPATGKGPNHSGGETTGGNGALGVPEYPPGASYDPSKATGSALGKQIVAYAMQFVGGTYILEGQWNGEIPYTPTCCAGFVSGVYRHFGFTIHSTWNGYWVPNIWSATDKYTIVTDGSIKAGDLVIYNDESHVAMLTGVGNQIVHAANPTRGVTLNDHYNYSNNVQAIIRINGVN